MLCAIWMVKTVPLTKLYHEHEYFTIVVILGHLLESYLGMHFNIKANYILDTSRNCSKGSLPVVDSL